MRSRWETGQYSIAEATTWVYDEANDAATVPVMMEVAQADAVYAKRALDYMRNKSAFARSLEIPAAALDKSLELMVNAGLLDGAAKDDARLAWDSRFARAAATAASSAR